jgi:hypothetical protein
MGKPEAAMTQHTNIADKAQVQNRTQPDLTGLFDEMQALMVLMPGTILDRGRILATDEETEAMFDNMPV